jgi:tetratricopeptide (TPR) repeat protein
MPSSIETLLSARLERLAPAERSFLEAASVIGEVFWLGAVGELAPPMEEVRAELTGLLDKQLVVADPTGFAGEPGYRFAHILVRDAAYRRLLKGTRAAHHEHFARWVERKAGARLAEYEEIVGYHLEQAHRYRAELGPEDDSSRALADEASERLGAAGGRAYERGDTAAAAGLLERAIALLALDDASRRGLALKLGVALGEAGKLDRADAVLSETVEAAAATGERTLELRAIVERGLVRFDMDPGAVATEAVTGLDEAGDDVGLARALHARALAPCARMRFAEAEADLGRALECLRRAGAWRHETEILLWFTLVFVFGPRPAGEGISRADELLRGSQPGTRVVLGVNVAPLHAMRGDFERARRDYRRAYAAIEELGHEGLKYGCTAFIGEVELLAGDPVAAERWLRQGYEAMHAMGDLGPAPTSAHMLARALSDQGRWEQAEHFVSECRSFALADDVDAQIGWRRASGPLKARRGEVDEGHRLAQEAVDLSRPTDSPNTKGDALMALGEVLHLAGEGAPAAEAIREAIDLYEAKENLVSARSARELLADLSS